MIRNSFRSRRKNSRFTAGLLDFLDLFLSLATLESSADCTIGVIVTTYLAIRYYNHNQEIPAFLDHIMFN